MSQGDVHVHNTVYESSAMRQPDEILADQDVGQVRVQMERLDKLSALLAEELDGLATRLDPVVRPEALLDGSTPVAPEPIRSKLAAQLSALADRHQAYITRLSELRGSLDL